MELTKQSIDRQMKGKKKESSKRKKRQNRKTEERQDLKQKWKEERQEVRNEERKQRKKWKESYITISIHIMTLLHRKKLPSSKGKRFYCSSQISHNCARDGFIFSVEMYTALYNLLMRI